MVILSSSSINKTVISLIFLLSSLSCVDFGYCIGDHGTSSTIRVMVDDFIQSVRLFGMISGGIGLILVGYWKWGMNQISKPGLEVYERPGLFKNNFGKKGLIIIGLLFFLVGVASLILCDFIVQTCYN